MDYIIIEKPGFNVVGKTRKFPERGTDNYIKVPQFWDEFSRDEDGNNILMELTQSKPGQVTGAVILGLCICEAGSDEFTYAIGVETEVRTAPAGFEAIHVPTNTWAVFDAIGPVPDSIQDVTKRVYREWFPSSGYEHGPEHELEAYLPGDRFSKNYHCQLWIPVVKADRKYNGPFPE